MTLTIKILAPVLKKSAQEIKNKYEGFVMSPSSSFFFNCVKEGNYFVNTLTLLILFTFAPESINTISKEMSEKFLEDLKIFLRLSKVNFEHVQTIFKTHEFSTH